MALVPYTITAIERDVADAAASGKQVVVGAVCSLFLQPSDVVAQLYDNAAGDSGSTSKVTNSSGQVTVWVESGDYRVSVNSNDSFISLQSGGETVTASVTETQTLAAAQTTVTLASLSTTNTAFYINGPDVDNGRLVLGVDFTLTSTATIELITAYADGTLITAVQNDGTEALFTAVKVFDNTEEMEDDTSLVAGDYVICKRYYAGGDLVDGLEFNVVATATVDGFIDHANDNGTFSILLASKHVTSKQAGALGDGVTDDTSPLQAALTYAKDKKVKLLIIAGVYSISSAISATNATDLEVQGVLATLKQSGDKFQSSLSVSDSTNVKVTGLSFEGTNESLLNETAYAGVGLFFTRCTNVEAKSNKFLNQSGSGIFFNLCNDVICTDNFIKDTVTFWDIAFGYASPPDNTPISNAVISNNTCVTTTGAWGIIVQGYGDNVTVTGNQTKGHNDYGIFVYRLDSFGARKWNNIIVNDNIVSDVSDTSFSGYFAGMGIYLQTVNKATVSGNVVTNVLQNRSDALTPNRTLTPAAISIADSTEITCVGNTVNGSGIDGIGMTSNTEDNLGSIISGNSISDCEWNGVYIAAIENVSITGNAINGNSNNKGSGVEVVSTSTKLSRNILVDGNSIEKGFSNGVNATKGTGASLFKLSISNNQITDVIRHYIQIFGATGLVVKGNNISAETVAHESAFYGIIVTGCFDAIVQGNIVQGGAVPLNRGLAVVNTDRALVSTNLIDNVTSITFALYLIGNTDTFVYENLNPRQLKPMIGTHSIGNDTSSDTGITVTYGTGADLPTGIEAGSIHWNLAPTAGGNVGWSYVGVGGWKTFGVISA